VSCKTADSGNHPDIVLIAPDKKTTISTEHVRGSVVSAVTVRPYRSKYKVFIIENAGLMGAASQNILLKTLEEPPDYAIFILLTEHEELFLPTVRSRVCVLKMPVSKGNSPDDGIKKAVASILENIKSLSPAEILIKVRALEEYKDSAELIPDIVAEWYRDVAVVDALVDIEHATRQTESAGKKLRANTGFQLVMEVLFLNLKRGA
jgi:DNA polymerase-3 subunit delta'